VCLPLEAGGRPSSWTTSAMQRRVAHQPRPPRLPPGGKRAGADDDDSDDDAREGEEDNNEDGAIRCHGVVIGHCNNLTDGSSLRWRQEEAK